MAIGSTSTENRKVSIPVDAMVVGLPGSGVTVYSEVRSIVPVKIRSTEETVSSDSPTFSTSTVTW